MKRKAPSRRPSAASSLRSARTVAPTLTPTEPSATSTVEARADAPVQDGSNLPANRGYLVVRFDGPPEARVYLNGKAAGPVGDRLEVACGRVFVRVGKEPGPSWLSKGAAAAIGCQSVTELTFEKEGP